MTSLLFCLIVPSAPVEDILARYASFRSKAPAFQVNYRSYGIACELLLDRKQRMRFRAKSPKVDYLCVVSNEKMRDMDLIARQYDELEGVPVGPPPSRMANVGPIFPGWVFYQDLRKIFNGGAKFVSLGKRTVGAVTGEAVRATVKMDGNTHTAEFLFDAAGIPRQAILSGVTQMRGYRFEYTVDRMVAANPQPSQFTFAIPDGFTPHALDTTFGPVGVGQPFPMKGWKSAKGGNLDLAGRLKSGGIVAILGKDSEPSQKARTSISRAIQSKLNVVVLADAPMTAVDGYDAGGALSALMAPSTPLFYRVDRSGKITAVWLGYDSAKAKQFERELAGE